MTDDTANKLLAQLIYSTKFHFKDEGQLQAGIGELLRRSNIPFTPEYRLTPQDRIDFIVGHVGIEVKVASTAIEVTRQLYRYAASSEIDSLILVSTKSAHRGIWTEIAGKPVRIVHLVHSIF